MKKILSFLSIPLLLLALAPAAAQADLFGRTPALPTVGGTVGFPSGNTSIDKTRFLQGGASLTEAILRNMADYLDNRSTTGLTMEAYRNKVRGPARMSVNAVAQTKNPAYIANGGGVLDIKRGSTVNLRDVFTNTPNFNVPPLDRIPAGKPPTPPRVPDLGSPKIPGLGPRR